MTSSDGQLQAFGITAAPLGPWDMPDLTRLLGEQRIVARWRLRGVTTSPTRRALDAWDNQLVVLGLRASAEGPLLGIVGAYKADLRNRHCFLNIAVSETAPPYTTGVGLALIMQYVFERWPMRKVYAEIPAYNVSKFASALRRGAVHELTLTGRELIGGDRSDVQLISLSREVWERRARRLEAVQTRRRQ